jgi:hypothetical protein
MEMVDKETLDGKTVIVTSTRGLFRREIRRFEEQRKLTPSFSEWLELPNRKLVPDRLSFQLDAWNRI